ncbi:MAG: ATP-binding protein [Bacteroidota bacterium]|mgnify:CR=1 FL=1|jgi:two-component system OmpR family sensor kinase/two-component system phosphate regulon sensor histidine kinase PhoR|nr:ATP-binding protein [Bacteroidota bacterium]HHU96681.1 two-component sensor histidine kinase [Petrimonas sp.]
MKKIVSYRTGVMLVFTVIIAAFTVGVILFEQRQWKEERTHSLEMLLECNADIVHEYIVVNQIPLGEELRQLEEQQRYMNPELRLTIIDWQGQVLFDNLMEATEMENHLQRPEIKRTIGLGQGTHIRRSKSTSTDYLYFAKKYEEGYFIRFAMPYDLQVKNFIHAHSSFIYYILIFFVLCMLMVYFFANRFSKSLKELRAFSLSVKQGTPVPSGFRFSDDEVGQVSADIVEHYTLLQENRRKLAAEREKLLQHFQYSEEGIAIFTAEREKIYANSYFLQFLNVILDEPTLEVEQIFREPVFGDLVAFLDQKDRGHNPHTQQIEKSGRQFLVRVIVFDDESFEIYLSDITRAEKTRQLKQEMTNNIAHELRTPVTSIRGYLETILDQPESQDNERVRHFLDRAYVQTIRLSELIQDIGMLTKIEEASDRFELEPVPLKELIAEVKTDLSAKLRETNAHFNVVMSDDVVIHGNRTLLYSIFRNLAENSIAYAGDNVEIVARCYSESDDAYFIEFHDNGVGVDEKHLVRIFERFYRVGEGRTRVTGGSGLGLSIVKNAVLFHKGSIVAKNRAEGGLSFLITFPKK